MRECFGVWEAYVAQAFPLIRLAVHEFNFANKAFLAFVKFRIRIRDVTTKKGRWSKKHVLKFTHRF